MKRVVLDTNVLVSFLTDRDAEQQAKAAALFESAAQGEVQLILHQMVISEMVYVLGNLYKVETQEIAGMLEDLLSSAGVIPVDEVLWTRVLEIWPGRFGDFADAVLAVATLEARYDAVATFDRQFVGQLRREELTPYWTSEGEETEAESAASSDAEVTE